ncbi:MAG: hypothetical protein COU47_03465 [Candidatus Niyogibacteria bacterium CG10_big_fil_rev_8_21_14_0_10_46_36]|uniref:Uncharacterized protein n=1 Tax=Candidatus Niyogibacteria bacterium CG10_big_fil_rev_8_21_14_0_10_46_36 TaxID=1974726 RepID=A0A2H0TCX0_9BACT|nr:MAG: hypothetical protein COU47_03465 [Candidatus Niyogibacteria bacterium CG10_big_fil_rev_8_21_14_0_10_46_36]
MTEWSSIIPRLLKVIMSISYRDDLLDAIRNDAALNSALQATPYVAFLSKLNAEERKGSDIGKQWASLPKREPKKAKKKARLSSEAAALEKRIKLELAQFVHSGNIKSEDDVDALYEQIRSSFGKDIKITQYRFGKRKYKSLIDDLLWTGGKDGTFTALKEIVRKDLPIEKFSEYHPHIPVSLVEKKKQEISGVTQTSLPVKLLPGVGRLTDDIRHADANFSFPGNSYHEPFVISGGKSDFSFIVINGPQVGMQYSKVIAENPVRCALAQAERDKCDAVLLTGTIDVDTKKAAGPTKALRALFSGRNTNVDMLNPIYQKEAKSILSEAMGRDIVYETTAEIFSNLLSGWRKITIQPDEQPEFNGDVFIVFGPKEEEIILAGAYWELHYNTMRKIDLILAEISVARSGLARAKKNGNTREERKLENKLLELQDLRTRTRMTNVSVEDWKKMYRKMLAFVVRSFEQTIPNAKVINKGTTYLKVNGSVFEMHIPSTLQVTDALLSKFVGSYAHATLRKSFADTVVICHPYAINHRVTAREIDAEGKRRSAEIHVAPICVDGVILRDRIKTITKSVHAIQRAVFHPLFNPGVLKFRCAKGLITTSMFGIDALRKHLRILSGAESKTKIADKYIYLFVGTDPHWGSRSKEFIWCDERREYLGMTECAFHLLRKYRNMKSLGVHMFVSNDDITQGHHFPSQKQPHQNQMPYDFFEKKWGEAIAEAEKVAENNDPKALFKLLRDMRDLSLDQIRVRGIDWVRDQLEEVLYRHLKPNVDIFDGILSSGTRAGLIVKGASHYLQTQFDRRDIGLINFGDGNHFSKTTDRNLMENTIVAQYLRLLLGQMKKWEKEKDLLDALVRDPIHGNQFIGWGTVEAPGGYVWAFDLRSSPTGLGIDWNDPFLKMSRNDMKRGNFTRFFENKYTVKVVGDKHFYTTQCTAQALYLMGPPGTSTDVYGELGFPPNNTGILFVGLPAEGPDAGPILFRPLLYDRLREYIEEKKPFDWDSFLPNPL